MTCIQTYMPPSILFFCRFSSCVSGFTYPLTPTLYLNLSSFGLFIIFSNSTNNEIDLFSFLQKQKYPGHLRVPLGLLITAHIDWSSEFHIVLPEAT